MSSSTHAISSSTSIPISLMSTPPSLFGSSVSTLSVSTKSSAPKKGRQPRKKKPVAGKKKKSQPISPSVGSDEGGDFEGGDFELADEEEDSPTFKASSASVIEQSNLRKTFHFSEVRILETEPPVSPQIQGEISVSKVNVENQPNAPSSGAIDLTSKDNETADGEESTDNNDDDDEEDDEEDETHSDCLEAVIDRGLFQLPCTNGLIDTFSAGVKSYILNKLRGMLKEEPAPDIVLEIADSIDLLRLVGASDPTLDDIGEKLGEGIVLYNKGVKKLNEGQDLLRSALSDISLLE